MHSGFLQATSASASCLSNLTPEITVALPRCSSDSRYAHQDTAPIADTNQLYKEDAEGPQTIQRLVLRKRTTSPYQIKLPYMADRLRVRRGASPAHKADAEATQTSAIPGAQVALGRTTPLFSGRLPIDDAELPALCTDVTRAVDNGISTPYLSTLDTWSEICEDLCRAMEIFSVVSDVAPANLFTSDTAPLKSATTPTTTAFRSSLDKVADPSCEALKASALSCLGPWSSFVFPLSAVRL
ncbi:hypothetical protein BD414DRAFT_578639 [Trametes punicea]|nr:hypothetical protein BD414DRAFT_578639 [Trametes punicea]